MQLVKTAKPMTTTLKIKPGGNLQGCIQIPGDKSVTHRALIIGALTQQNHTVVLHNWLQSLDCIATLNALRSMGVAFVQDDVASLQINCVGLKGLQSPDKVLYIGNSGTSIRLLTGILVAQNFSSVITGDESICTRPMRRIIVPLTQMGAKIAAQQDEFAPLYIEGKQTLRAINYNMPMASAQVKSAILLASLYTSGKSLVHSPHTCRDHTEILLQFFANESSNTKKTIQLNIPGDISTAAFFIVGASITPGADIILKNIGFNSTRTGIIEILQRMGADIIVAKTYVLQGEVHADLRIRHVSQLSAITVPLELVANAIDELPVLCLAAACARGTTVIRGASELRFKESDRIAMLAQGFTRLGIKLSVFNDGLAITGGVISGGEVASGGDHRIAMTFAMAGLVAQQDVIVHDTGNIATSFPTFAFVAREAGMLITEEQACLV